MMIMFNDPFFYNFWCGKHKRHTEHTVTFILLDATNKVVKFSAFCNECLDEAEENGQEYVNGWVSEMPICDWRQIQPKADEAELN